MHEEPHSKFKVVGIIIATIIAVGVLAGLAWKIVNRDKAEKLGESSMQSIVNSAPATEETPAALTPEDITAKVKSTFTARYTLIESKRDTKPAAGQMSYSITKNSPSYKAEGYVYSNTYDGGSSFSGYAGPIDTKTDKYPRQAETDARKDIVSIFTAAGLAKTGTTGESDLTKTDVYVGKDIVCTVTIASAPTATSDAKCGTISAYTAAAATIKPLADAIGNITEKTSFAVPTITDSSVAGYQRASVGVNASLAKLWRKGTCTWTYFKSVQNLANCSDYSTVDLKSAFKGENCYDTATKKNSTVQ